MDSLNMPVYECLEDAHLNLGDQELHIFTKYGLYRQIKVDENDLVVMYNDLNVMQAMSNQLINEFFRRI